MIYRDFPIDEKPLQKGRRQFVGLFALGLFLLSVGLELHQRDVDVGQLLDNVRRILVAGLEPGSPLPSIDLFANLLALASVLRNMLPTIFVLLLVLWFGDRFVQAIYGLANQQEASAYLRTSLFGTLVGPGPFIVKLFTTLLVEPVSSERMKSGPTVIVKDGGVAGDPLKPVMRVGGPGAIAVQSDSAVLLEQAGRLTRVLGPGFEPLQRFEKVRAIVDLRPRWHHVTATGMSREGIPVQWTLDIHLQINDEGQGRHEATENRPYPYCDEALLKAATSQQVSAFEETEHADWRQRVGGIAMGLSRSLMSRHSVEDLVMPSSDLSPPPRQQIQNTLKSELRESAAGLGAKILDVTLRDIQFREPVAEQWVETWKAGREKQRAEILAQGEAADFRTIQAAKAQAKKQMLEAIRDGLRPDDQLDAKESINPEITLMRFAETMEHLFDSPGFTFGHTTASNQSLQMLRQILDLLGKRAGPHNPQGNQSQP